MLKAIRVRVGMVCSRSFDPYSVLSYARLNVATGKQIPRYILVEIKKCICIQSTVIETGIVMIRNIPYGLILVARKKNRVISMCCSVYNNPYGYSTSRLSYLYRSERSRTFIIYIYTDLQISTICSINYPYILSITGTDDNMRLY